MKCPTCNGEMKALLTSTYCPKDCDRKVVMSQRKLGDLIFAALKENFGDFIYAPRRPVTFIDVQSMTQPKGAIFYMDYEYVSKKK